MAIVQVSRITHRKGELENLPQLAGAELGWAVDERKLYIGNGTLAEGAPVIGNTEILTEHSDLQALIDGDTSRITANLTNTSGSIVNVATDGGNVTFDGNGHFLVSYEYTTTSDGSTENELRRGTITVAYYTSEISYSDEYVENADTGLELFMTESSGNIAFQYRADSAGTLTYIVKNYAVYS